MPTITINGRKCDFTPTPGSPPPTIMQVANANGIEIPQYCYHDGLSIVASCRICLAEIHSPDPKTGQIVPQMGGKLQPTCQTTATDGMVVYADSPKAVQNQKAVMEFLLINHPLDCPVCDQSGECFLQDYSYEYGRGVSRFEEDKVKQPKKDLGPHVYLYSDRCIMCTRCVRFTREVSGTSELLVQGRGNKEEIDVFPGIALANELSANVIDLCPVGALLDKDFLFTQRVWFLKETAAIDPITASGDNIWIHHNEGKVYRLKPRQNLKVNKWWITDEVRYGWKFVHSEDRLRSPQRKQFSTPVECDYTRAYDDAVAGMKKAVGSGAGGGKQLAAMISPMLTCEEAFLLAKLALAIDPRAVLAVGPVPVHGQDKVYPPNAKESDLKAFKVYAEKAPNARGVRRVLAAMTDPRNVKSYEDLLLLLGKGTGTSNIGAILLTGNYPSDWATDELQKSLGGKFVVLIDTLSSPLLEKCDVVIPGATFAEKAGTFENAKNMLQSFEQAIPVIELAKSEGQIALDLIATLEGRASATQAVTKMVVQSSPGQVASGTETIAPSAELFNASDVRVRMAKASPALGVFITEVSIPAPKATQEPDMQVVEL
jgi:NADH-quinone oxidoreductase subunit G